MMAAPTTAYYRSQLEFFKEHLRRLGYSAGTQDRYSRCTRYFFLWLEARGILHARKIRAAHIVQYRSYEEERPNQNLPGTPSLAHVQISLLAVRAWLHYLQQSGALKENPMSAIHIGSVKHEPRDTLTLEEVKELYGACKSLRERALLTLFYGCGLRRSEAVKLNIKDVHFKSGLLYVREGKGKKRRVIPMGTTVANELRCYYMRERTQYIRHTTPDNQEAFVLNNTGDRMGKDSARKMVRKILERTTITKKITLHGLRHSIATHLLESGMSLEYVRDFLGHEFIDTTQLYTRITAKHLQTL
jgi:integrase/recombinase XerD